MGQFTALSHTNVRGWMSDALDLFITKETPRKTFAHKMGCSIGAIDNYRKQESTPSLPVFLCICKALGPQFVNFILAKIGMTGARWVENGTKCHRTMHAHVAELNKIYTQVFMDGIVDEDEERQLILPLLAVGSGSAGFLAN